MHALDQLATDLARLDRQHAAEQAAMLERQARERAAVLASARGEGGTPAPSNLSNQDALPDDLLRPKEAQHAFNLSKSVLFRLGAAHPLSKGGFCFDGRGVQLFSKSRLAAFLAKHPRRRQRGR